MCGNQYVNLIPVVSLIFSSALLFVLCGIFTTRMSPPWGSPMSPQLSASMSACGEPEPEPQLSPPWRSPMPSRLSPQLWASMSGWTTWWGAVGRRILAQHPSTDRRTEPDIKLETGLHFFFCCICTFYFSASIFLLFLHMYFLCIENMSFHLYMMGFIIAWMNGSSFAICKNINEYFIQ